MKKYTRILAGMMFLLVSASSYYSCSTHDEENPNCLAVVYPDTLRFVILNKDTNEDLFFSEDPKYGLEELKLYFKAPDNNLRERGFEVSGGSDNKHFYAIANTGAKRDSLFLSIAEQPLDTIAYTTKKLEGQPCPTYILDFVKFNNEAPELDAHDRIVQFLRQE